MWRARDRGGDASPENYCEEPAASETEHRHLSTCNIPPLVLGKFPWKLSHPQLRNVAPRKRTVSEHSLVWMQKWISASCLNDSGGEAVWSGLIYGWLKYTVIKIMRHRLILQNIRYSPTGTWKAPNCDAQTNTKNLSNCAQLGLFLHLYLHLYGWLAAF